MEKFREVRVRYTYPAIPPIGIAVNKIYKVGCLLDTYKLNDLIKLMFSPVDTTWDKLNDKKAKKSKTKEVVAKDLKINSDGAE